MPDLSALATTFIQNATIFRRNVLNWNLRENGIQVRTNVKAPQALTKLSAVGGPRPYRTQDDFANAAKFEDRLLTVYQSKWDFPFDAEDFRNTYLAVQPDAPFEQACIDQVSREYLDQVTRLTLYGGVRNAAGTAAGDLWTGWGKIIADEITATHLTPVVTGAITAANAVAKVELVADSVPIWMKERGYNIYCSHTVFEYYATNYRATFGFRFNADATGKYKLDNRLVNLIPVAWMGTSQRLIATVDNNLVFGTDLEGIQVYATPHLNILQVRLTLAGGEQIQDLEAMAVNDVA